MGGNVFKMLKLLGHSDLNGRGETMQLMFSKNYLYVGHMLPGCGTSIVDVSSPSKPKLCARLPGFSGTKSPKIQLAGDILLVNYEQAGHQVAQRSGFGVFDISNPLRPREIAYYPIEKRTHRIWYTGERYAYVSAAPAGFRDRIFLIIDMKNPEKPIEVGRWWLKGQWEAGGEIPDWPANLNQKLHHGLVSGNRAYLGYWDAGVITLDIADKTQPKFISRLSWAPNDGSCTHTALPLPSRKLLVVTDESTKEFCQEPPKYVRIVDIGDEKDPHVLSKFRVSDDSFCKKGLRFGPHNLHENRPGTFISDTIIFVTYFNAGLRVLDIKDPYDPIEVGHFIPELPVNKIIQINDVLVEKDGRVYISDRVGGGIFILQADL